MTYTITGANVFTDGFFSRRDIVISDGIIVSISSDAPKKLGGSVFKYDGAFVFPGFADVHVHLREPGNSYKESMLSGTLAAARGGFTAVCAMPNLSPVPDCAKTLEPELEAIRASARVRVLPYGALTVGERGEKLAALEELADSVVAFSDDGRGVQDPQVMKQAMKQAKALGKLIAAHCEDESLLNGGYIHDGEYCRAHSHKGISSESEWRMVRRDIELAAQTGCAYHVCHVSTKESVELIRQAKRDGLDVSGETAPHYLLLCDEELREDGSFKMNPPIRSRADRDALIRGIQDGTIEMIATDHAPHSAEEKSRGLAGSLNGVVGLETAFPALYTGLVLPGVISLEKLVTLMSVSPCRRFGLPCGLRVGAPADLTVFDLDSEYEIDPDDFLSLGRATPFAGKRVKGKCLMTMIGGEPVYRG